MIGLSGTLDCVWNLCQQKMVAVAIHRPDYHAQIIVTSHLQKTT